MFKYDSLRCALQGVVDVEFRTFILLIAIRQFHMPTEMKALLETVGLSGMLLAPITQKLTGHSGLKISTVCCIFFLIISIAVLLSAFSNHWQTYLIFAAISRFIYKQPPAIIIDIYDQNYTKEERGTRLSLSMIFMAISGLVFSKISSILLDKDLANFRVVLAIAAVAALLCALSFFKVPSRPLIKPDRKSLFENFHLVYRDKLFGYILFCWALVGIANQMTMPLRIEYLANEKYGINFSNKTLTYLAVIIPTASRIVSSYFWGRIFDKLKFVPMKQLVNVCHLIGVPLFLLTKDPFLLGLASVFLGLAYGGGVIAWSLWVTKVAPSNKLSEYTSVDLAMGGLKNFISPGIGYFLLTHTNPATVGKISFIMILTGMIGFHFIGKFSRLR
jgi:predicted MFS family arabinose efflux permease